MKAGLSGQNRYYLKDCKGIMDVYTVLMYPMIGKIHEGWLLCYVIF